MFGLWSQSPPAQPTAPGNVTRTDAGGICSLRCKRCKAGVDWPVGSFTSADIKWFSIIHADEGSAHVKLKGARR